MGIFDWLFGKGTNKEIERKERMKKTFGKYREEINQKKKKEDEEKAKKEAFLNENKKVLCDDGVERLWFYNKRKIIEQFEGFDKVSVVLETGDFQPILKFSEEAGEYIPTVKDEDHFDHNLRYFGEFSKNPVSIPKFQWFDINGNKMALNQILISEEFPDDEVMPDRYRITRRRLYGFGFCNIPVKEKKVGGIAIPDYGRGNGFLVFINQFLLKFRVKLKPSSASLTAGQDIIPFSGKINKYHYGKGNIYENGKLVNNKTKRKSTPKTTSYFDLIENKKLEINDKSQDERIGFFVEEIIYDSVNEIVYRLGKQYKDGDDWYQEENTDELITFFTDKDDKFINFPENFEEEVVTSYDNGAYCISELNKVFLEHHKHYNITDPTVYDKKQILKILKDLK